MTKAYCRMVRRITQPYGKRFDRRCALVSEEVYCFASSIVPNELWDVDYNSMQAISKQVAEDWWGVFGGANNALIAEARCNEENGDMVYNADIKYYVYDYYDWDGHMYETSHRYGLAKIYFSKGCFSFEVKWIKGKRYPKAVNVYFPIETTKFDGIDDNSSLQNAYEFGLQYYNFINTQNRIGLYLWSPQKTTFEKD